MAIAFKHQKVSTIPDDPVAAAAGEILSSDWNDDHDLTMATARLLGRVSSGAGVVEELTASQVATFLDLIKGTAAGNIPVLDGGGKLDTSVIPALALTEAFEVASQSAMLALTAQPGDIAIRTDLNKTFVLAASPASTLGNWKELRTPTDVVLAVAGLTGTITAAALKTALAIAVADITDMTANGRSLVQAANYLAMFNLLKQAATTSATGVVELMTAAEMRSRTANLAVTPDQVGAAKAAVALTYSATRSLVWTDGWYRTCTLTGNMTISNPTSVEAGDTIMLRLVGSDATERSISWGTNFKGSLPDVTVTSTRAVLVSLTATTTTEIVVSYQVIE